MAHVTLYPPIATPGTEINITSGPPSPPLDFTAMPLSLLLSPDKLPAGIPGFGTAGTTAFGYPLASRVIDGGHMAFTVPAIVADPLQGVTEGGYSVLGISSTGYVTLGHLVISLSGRYPHPPGAWFTAINVPYIPVGCYVPPDWTFWYDSPNHPWTDSAYWSIASNWPTGSWKWGPLPPPPPGWHEAYDPLHGYVIVVTPGWGWPKPPTPAPAGWPPWQSLIPPPSPPPSKPVLPPPITGLVTTAPVVSSGHVRAALAAKAGGGALSLGRGGGTGPGSVFGTFPTGSKTGSGVEPHPEPLGSVRWLVEAFSPLRTGTGPKMDDRRKDHPDLYDDAIPVEHDGGSPPVRMFDLIVSAQLTLSDTTPMVDSKVSFDFLDAAQAPAGDDSQILHVTDNFDILNREMKSAVDKVDEQWARTDQDGKVYCRMHLRLLDQASLANVNERLKGIRLIIGDPQPTITASMAPAAATALLTNAANALLTTTAASTPPPPNPGFFASLKNILVDPLKDAVVTVIEKVGDVVQSIGAALPRTYQQAIGFALRRLADGIILAYAPFLSLLATDAEREEARAVIIGLLLGVPRGIWAMGRDQIDQLKQIVVDLPRALYNFFAEDPKFALQVLGSIANPLSGTVTYALDPDFQQKINKAFNRFAKLMDNLGEMIRQLWAAAKNSHGSFVSSLASFIYDSFKDTCGSIAVTYLSYVEDSDDYTYFVTGFMAGDLLGYIVGTIGLQIIIGYLTAGIGSLLGAAVTAMSKISILAKIGGLLAKVIAVFADIVKAIQVVAKQLQVALKEGVMKVVMGFLALIEKLTDKLLVPILEALVAAADKIFRMILQYAVGDGTRLRAMAEGIVAIIDDTVAPMAKDIIESFAELAERKFVAVC